MILRKLGIIESRCHNETRLICCASSLVSIRTIPGKAKHVACSCPAHCWKTMSEYSVHGRRKQLLALLWVLNLAVTAQLLFSLIFERGEFIQLDEASISPYGIHHHQANLSPAGDLQHSVSSPMLFIAILCIYPTLVLNPFAMMSLAFGIYSPDSSSWGLGVALQGSSSILMFAGILFFVGATWEYFHLSKITLSFMLCVCLCFEMALGAFVSWKLRKWNQLKGKKK
ncbi:uncharacterized protein [Lepisosteus oculatus]|uniref:uncharacterized protein n=1 Tax=Lepisosteus oculatus TaxID=7918 RepID=UPI003718EBCC